MAKRKPVTEKTLMTRANRHLARQYQWQQAPPSKGYGHLLLEEVG